jgi:hypothetical protein
VTFKAMLAARAHEEGRAQRSALLRHRSLAANPLCIVAWQLGAEPYSPGAIAMGTQAAGYELFVPGYPLDRDLLFAEMTGFATRFCTAFEAYAKGQCEPIDFKGNTLMVPQRLPQIIVANVETVGLLGRIGRRLAYLPTTGDYAADPLLPRLGRHLMWLAEHAQFPGQQLIMPVTDLLTSHYVTAMSPYEVGSLPAIDAWIAPGRGRHGFNAAEQAEHKAVGPVPDPKDGEKVFELMKTFNSGRAGSKDLVLLQKLVKPLRALYDAMVADTWNLIWKAIDRERPFAEAPSVTRRVLEDRIAYAAHLAWMAGPAEGRRKTRMTARSAAMHLSEMERAHAMVEAEEAIDDPLRMAPVLLAGKAIAGTVTQCDPNRRELINWRKSRRPSITVITTEPCVMPLGTMLWWTASAAGREWVVHRVESATGGSKVTLVLQTSASNSPIPNLRDRICFSQLNTKPGYELHLPKDIPWTHRAQVPEPAGTDLDFGGTVSAAA